VFALVVASTQAGSECESENELKAVEKVLRSGIASLALLLH
jgi:hypothetical protein